MDLEDLEELASGSMKHPDETDEQFRARAQRNLKLSDIVEITVENFPPSQPTYVIWHSAVCARLAPEIAWVCDEASNPPELKLVFRAQAATPEAALAACKARVAPPPEPGRAG